MSLREAPFDCDHNKKHVWSNMAFNVMPGTKEAVQAAFDVLGEEETYSRL